MIGISEKFINRMIEISEKFINRLKVRIRKEKILKECGCITYCPFCKEPLNDQAEWVEPDNDGRGYYHCSMCNQKSEWHFGIAPVPLLLHPKPHLKSSQELWKECKP